MSDIECAKNGKIKRILISEDGRCKRFFVCKIITRFSKIYKKRKIWNITI